MPRQSSLPVCAGRVGIALSVLCAPSDAAQPLPPPPWVVKITPIYSGGLTRIEIQYTHREKPFSIRAGGGGGILIRPTIQVSSAGDLARFGLDGKLSWDGMCSVSGQWLVVDADCSGPGLATANLRYNLRTRRLIVSSGDAQMSVDLNDGNVSGAEALTAGCRNLRDYFLSRNNQPFSIRVSDRPGCSGTIWFFSDMASVAIGPADVPWFNATASSPAKPQPIAWPDRPPIRTPPFRLEDPRVGARSAAVMETRREASDNPPRSFGDPTLRPYKLAAAVALRPKPLTSWPGKGLPPRAVAEVCEDEIESGDRLIMGICRYWCRQTQWVRHVAETVQAIAETQGCGPQDEKRVNEHVEKIAQTAGFNPHQILAASSIGVGTVAFDVPFETRSGLETFHERLRRLADAIETTLISVDRSIRTVRALSGQAADLAESERNFQSLNIGTSTRDSVLCLLMDLAAEPGPLPDRRRLAALVAQRLLGEAREDVLARLWGRRDLLETLQTKSGLRQPWGQMPLAGDATLTGELRLDAAADQAVAMLAAAFYQETPSAKSFQQYLSRRYLDPLNITPDDVAGLVEDLAVGGTADPVGLNQLLTVCGHVRQERRQLTDDMAARIRAAVRLCEGVGRWIDAGIARRGQALTKAREAESVRRRAIIRQKEEVQGLLEWVCRTYADQIFGRPELTPRQRKTMILSTMSWWVRQWQMDLCWVMMDFDVEIKRQDNAYSWRLDNVRVEPLDEPDPDAMVEERMATTPPPQEFPLGAVELASGKIVFPRTLDEMGPEPTGLQQSPTVASNNGASSRRMILPLQTGAELASADMPESRAEPIQPTSPPVQPPTERQSASVGHPQDGTPVNHAAKKSHPQRSAVHAGSSEAEGPVEVEPTDLGPQIEPEPPTDDKEVSLPLMLRPGTVLQPRHVAVTSGQWVMLMGMVAFEQAPGKPVRVCIDVKVDGPPAESLGIATSPQAMDEGRPSEVNLVSGKWLRRTIGWSSMTESSEPFTIQFQAPAPTSHSQTVRMAVVLAWEEEGRPVGLTEQIYIFHLLKRAAKDKQLVSAQ